MYFVHKIHDLPMKPAAISNGEARLPAPPARVRGVQAASGALALRGDSGREPMSSPIPATSVLYAPTAQPRAYARTLGTSPRNPEAPGNHGKPNKGST